MARYIDADELLNNTDGLEHVKYSQEYGHVVLVCDIVYAQTIDAVEVVRCKDCKHRDKYDCNKLTFGDIKCCVPDDWFCADGERRE